MIPMPRMVHESWDREPEKQPDGPHHPVNVLSDNANGAAPLGTARPRLKRS